MQKMRRSLRKKQSKCYIIFYEREKNFVEWNELASRFGISTSRVRQIVWSVYYEMHHQPEEFRKNFLQATGFQFTEKI